MQYVVSFSSLYHIAKIFGSFGMEDQAFINIIFTFIWSPPITWTKFTQMTCASSPSSEYRLIQREGVTEVEECLGVT